VKCIKHIHSRIKGVSDYQDVKSMVLPLLITRLKRASTPTGSFRYMPRDALYRSTVQLVLHYYWQRLFFSCCKRFYVHVPKWDGHSKVYIVCSTYPNCGLGIPHMENLRLFIIIVPEITVQTCPKTAMPSFLLLVR